MRAGEKSSLVCTDLATLVPPPPLLPLLPLHFCCCCCDCYMGVAGIAAAADAVAAAADAAWRRWDRCVARWLLTKQPPYWTHYLSGVIHAIWVLFKSPKP